MLIHKGFRYRAYPSPATQAMLARWFGCARVVHNLGLDQRRMFSRKGRSFGYTKQTADLPALKAEFPGSPNASASASSRPSKTSTTPSSASSRARAATRGPGRGSRMTACASRR